MSFETERGHFSGGQDRDTLPFLTSRISLDGRIPKSEQMIPLRGSRREKAFLIYPMGSDSKLVATNTRQITEDPQLNPFTDKLLLEAGITDFSIERDKQTDAITQFDITVRPEIDVESLPILQGLAMATESNPELWLSQLQSFFPVCHINAGEGVSLYNADSFVFGYGPAYAEDEDAPPLLFGDGFLEQVEIGIADMPDSMRRSLQIEYTVYNNFIDIYTGNEDHGPSIITIRGGLIIHRTPFRRVEKACRRILETQSEDKKKLFNIVEPYYAVSFIPEKWVDFEDYHDL